VYVQLVSSIYTPNCMQLKNENAMLRWDILDDDDSESLTDLDINVMPVVQ
jgi:hypothetical protein